MHEEIIEAISKYKYVSFDIFDTLLIRPFVKPSDLFDWIEESLNLPGFALERVQAERRARSISKTQEVTLDEIYEASEKLTPEQMMLEIEAERDSLRANPEMMEVYQRCLKDGKEIIITSDIYLDKNEISELLLKNGYSGWARLYISSDHRVMKEGGKRFEKLLETEEILPSEIIHIGDNPKSDFEYPKRVGMTALLYTKLIDRALSRSVPKRFFNQSLNSLTSSMILGMLQDRLGCSCVKDSYWHDFGYMYGGPLLLGFVSWLGRKAEADGIEELLFIGRDGYVLKPIFERLGFRIPAKYIFAPRHMCAVMAMRAVLDDPSVEWNYKDVLTFIEYLKDRGFNLKSGGKAGNKGDEYVKHFINSELLKYDEFIDREILSYKEYLNGLEVGSSRKIGVIDSVTINFSSQRLIKEVLKQQNIIGYYWATHPLYDVPSTEFRAFDPSRNDKFVNWDLMEIFMSAPYPGVDYIKDGEVFF